MGEANFYYFTCLKIYIFLRPVCIIENKKKHLVREREENNVPTQFRKQTNTKNTMAEEVDEFPFDASLKKKKKKKKPFDLEAALEGAEAATQDSSAAATNGAD